MAPTKKKNTKSKSVDKCDPDYQRKRKNNNIAVQKSREKQRKLIENLQLQKSNLKKHIGELDEKTENEKEKFNNSILKASAKLGCSPEELKKILDESENLSEEEVQQKLNDIYSRKNL